MEPCRPSPFRGDITEAPGARPLSKDRAASRKACGMNRLTEALGACWRRYRRASILTMIVFAATFATPSLASATYTVTTRGGPVETEPHVY